MNIYVISQCICFQLMYTNILGSNSLACAIPVVVASLSHLFGIKISHKHHNLTQMQAKPVFHTDSLICGREGSSYRNR